MSVCIGYSLLFFPGEVYPFFTLRFEHQGINCPQEEAGINHEPIAAKQVQQVFGHLAADTVLITNQHYP